MSRIDDIEARANAATEDERTLRSTIADDMPIGITWRWAMEQDYNNGGGQARFFYDSPTPRDVESLIAFVRDVEARHKRYTCDDGCCAWCEGCERAWPCPDREALDRLNGGA